LHNAKVRRMGDKGYKIRDTGYKIRDTGYGIQDTRYGIRDTGYGITTVRLNYYNNKKERRTSLPS